MTLAVGDKVTVTGHYTDDHGFETGDVVEFTGAVIPTSHRGVWRQFEDTEGFTQFLLEEHFTVQGGTAAKPVVEKVKAVDANLPSKQLYAVVKADGNIRYSGDDRETAREIKSILGGKKAGVRIFSYSADKEIR